MIFLDYASASGVKPCPVIDAMSALYKKQGFLNVRRSAMKKSKLKDCFGEETMIKYAFEKPVTKDLVEKLQKKYPVELFYEFPKPFFRVNLACKFLLTGFIGLTEIKVTYRKKVLSRNSKGLRISSKLFNLFEVI